VHLPTPVGPAKIIACGVDLVQWHAVVSLRLVHYQERKFRFGCSYNPLSRTGLRRGSRASNHRADWAILKEYIVGRSRSLDDMDSLGHWPQAQDRPPGLSDEMQDPPLQISLLPRLSGRSVARTRRKRPSSGSRSRRIVLWVQ